MEYYGARSSSQFLPRALFVLLLCVSLTAAAVPVLLFIDRPSWLLWVLAGSLLTGIPFLARPRTRQARPLTNLEKFLAVIAALFRTSAAALYVVLPFILVRLLALALGPASIWVRIFWYVAVGIACFFLLGGLMTTGRALIGALFPKVGVGNAPLFPGFTWRKVALPGFLGLLVIAVLGLLASFGWSYAYVAMIVVLLIASAPVYTAFALQKYSTGSAPVFEAVKALLVASGYRIWGRVQTGEVALDRLIAVFDLVAEKEGNVLALQVKTVASGSEAVTWTEASALRTAVWALYRGAERQQAKIRNIRPVLVLFGRTADPALVDFCKEESIGLAVVPSDAPLEAIAKGDFQPDQLIELTKNYMHIGVETSGVGQATPVLPAESTP